MMKEIDNLLVKMKECGCSKKIIDVYEGLIEQDDKACAIASFRKYRKELQKEVEQECKSIDCIDYIIYEIEKKKQK